MNSTDSWKILAGGSCNTAPDNGWIDEKLLYLSFLTDEPGVKPKNRAVMLRCKPCLLSHDVTIMLKQLPVGFSQYVLTNYLAKSPPHNMTVEDTDRPLERVVVDRISGHQLVRGRGGGLALTYQTHWRGIIRVTWASELDLRYFRREILLYWVGDAVHHCLSNK